MKFEKLKPEKLLRKISIHRRTVVFNISMFFLCASIALTVLIGLLERDGVFQTSAKVTTPPASATAIPTRMIGDPYYISVNIGADPLYLNSITAEDKVTKTILRHMLEGLVRLDQNNAVIPGAAASWKNSGEDKLTWTFTLHKNSLWQDKTRVKSTDFKAAIDLHISENSPYKTQITELFSKVECPDDDTIVFTLKNVDANFPSILAETQFFPIQKSLYDANKFSYGKEAANICYNGPWYVVLWEHDQRIVLSKNDNYWNAKNISLKQLLFMTAGTSDSKLKYFESGHYDMVFIKPIEIDKYAEANYTLKNYADGSVVYLDFNKKDLLLKNDDLRKALSLSIDRNAFVTNTVKSGATPVEGYDFTKDLAAAKLHLEAARKALDTDFERGLVMTVDNGEIDLDGDGSPDTSESLIFAAALAKQWKENLGIDIKVQTLSYAERIEQIEQGTVQITINSLNFTGTLPEAPLYFKHTVFATNGRIKDIITSAGRDIDLYYAKP